MRHISTTWRFVVVLSALIVTGATVLGFQSRRAQTSRPAPVPQVDRSDQESTPLQRSSNGKIVVTPADQNIVTKLESAGRQSLVYTVKNEGPQPVRLLHVGTTCGCTEPRLEKDVLKSGEATEMTVKVGLLETGEKRVRITLETDSNVTPAVTVFATLVGWQSPPFVRSSPPQSVSLTFSGDGNSARRLDLVTVERASDSPWIIGATSNEGSVEAKVTLVGEETYIPAVRAADSDDNETSLVRRTYETVLQPSALPRSEQEGSVDVLRFVTEPAAKPPGPIQVTIRPRPRVTASPDSLFVKSSAPGKANRARLILKSFLGPLDWDALSITAEQPEIEVNLVERRVLSPEICLISLEISAAQSGEPQKTVLLARGTQATNWEIRIPLHIQPIDTERNGDY